MRDIQIYHEYDKCSEFEKKRFKDGYIILKEYEDFYLCGKINDNQEILYRECFSRFDIDGARQKVDLRRKPFTTGYNRILKYKKRK